VQNAVARLITDVRRCEHITLVLRQRHWLPDDRRVDCKLAVLFYKALHRQTAPYLPEHILLLADAGKCSLRSAVTLTVVMPKIRTKLGDRKFSVTGSRLWSSLPVEWGQRDIDFI
jgi:hypothetical protein